MGSQICDAISYGWDSEQMKECLAELEQLTGNAAESIQTKIKTNIDKAVEIARQFGAHDASRFIQPDQRFQPTLTQEEEGPDKKQIQFQILQDISGHISGEVDLNVLFEMVLEGIHRGVEMDRTLFMLLGIDKKSLNEKISLGWQESGDGGKIRIYKQELSTNLLFHGLNQADGIWLSPKQQPGLYTSQIEKSFGRHECFAFSIRVEHKPIGLIYCDRGIRNQPLTAEDFSTVKHFVKQAQIGLTLYRMKNH
jgi:hypothetical protein